jgi:hypothetical protein
MLGWRRAGRTDSAATSAAKPLRSRLGNHLLSNCWGSVLAFAFAFAFLALTLALALGVGRAVLFHHLEVERVALDDLGRDLGVRAEPAPAVFDGLLAFLPEIAYAAPVLVLDLAQLNP